VRSAKGRLVQSDQLRSDAEFDRELSLFMTELRVELPGVQILFGFMLSVPFSEKFNTASDLERNVYFLGFASCAIASALLIAPSVYHRLHWRHEVGRRDRMLASFNRFAVLGGVFLAIAMNSTIFVIGGRLFGLSAAVILTIIGIAMFGWLWFGFPAARRVRELRSGRRGSAGERH
jgi:hypothetical protein